MRRHLSTYFAKKKLFFLKKIHWKGNKGASKTGWRRRVGGGGKAPPPTACERPYVIYCFAEL